MIRPFVAALAGFGRRRLALVAALTLAAAASEGTGLLLLVPLLAVAGVVPGTAAGPPSWLPVPAGGGLVGVLACFLAVCAGRAVLVRARDVRAAALQADFTDDLRVRLYRAVAGAGWRHLAVLRRSDLMHTLTSDVLRVGAGTRSAFDLAVSAAVTAAYVAVAAALSPPATAAAGGVAVVVLLVARPLVRRARRLGEQLTVRNRRLYATATGFLDGIKAAKAANGEAAYVDAFAGVVREERAAMLAYQRAVAGTAATYAVGSAALLAGLVSLAVGWAAVEPARLLVLVLVFARLLPLVGGLVQRAQQLAHTLPAFVAVQATLRGCVAAMEPAVGASVAVARLADRVRLRGVTVRLAADRPAALRDVDLTIEAGATTAVVGPSGAGKSTLADVLCGLLPPTAGRLEVDGVAVEGARARAWREQVAYVPQDTVLAPGTIADHLRRHAPDADDRQLWRALRDAAAEDFVRALPDGLATEVGDRGGLLSGGERQRLAIAGALLRRPSLLVLDESTSALDTEHERDVRAALAALRGRLTVVVIAHRLSAVRDADRIAVLDAGRLVETGTWAELTGRSDGRLRDLALAAGVAV
ncbi:MAG TPA: ABC transporter ATP-binding protein [Pilimelia sp.]|nr:ABC transporter ATP-binding protein [Pilimelia sp.]